MANILSSKLVTLASSSALVVFLSLSVSSGPTISAASSIQRSKTCLITANCIDIEQERLLMPYCWGKKCIYCAFSANFRAETNYAEECRKMRETVSQEMLDDENIFMKKSEKFATTITTILFVAIIAVLVVIIGCSVLVCCFCCACCPVYKCRNRRNELPEQIMMVNPYPAYPQYPYGNPGQPQFQNQYAAPPPYYNEYPNLPVQPVQGSDVTVTAQGPVQQPNGTDQGPVQQPVQQQNVHHQKNVKKAKS